MAGIVGVIGELLVFGPLVKRKTNSLGLMVASIGYGLVIRQIIQELFTASNKTITLDYPTWFTSEVEFFNTGFFFNLGILATIPVIGVLFSMLFWNQTRLFLFGSNNDGSASIRMYNLFNVSDENKLEFLGIEWKKILQIELTVNRSDVWVVICMVIFILLLRYIFNRTTLGISMRATADSEELAEISGINTRRVILWSWFLAGGVTGVGAIFLYRSATIIPFAGFNELLIIFAIVVLGGFDSFEGTLVAGFIITYSKQVFTFFNLTIAKLEATYEWLDPFVFWNTAGYSDEAGPFAIMILVLLIRPRGLFGLIDPRSKL